MGAKCHVCWRCNKKSEGRTCAACRANKKAARAARKAAGLCCQEGCRAQAAKGRGGLCDCHADRALERHREYRERRRREKLAGAPISELLQDYDAIL